MSAIIYRITNQVNGKFYVGKTIQSLSERLNDHYSAARRGSKTHFHRAIRKYGFHQFEASILEQTTLDLINAREMYWIESLSPPYNMTTGGEGGSPNQEVRDKISATLRGRIVSPEVRAKMSSASRASSKRQKGYRKHSQESIAKIKAAAQNRPPVSKETRNKQSESQKAAWERRKSDPRSPDATNLAG